MGDVVVRVRCLAAVAALLGAVAGSALAVEPGLTALEELRQRAIRRQTASLEGRLYIERPKPDAPDIPLVGVGLLLVPRSEDLLERLEGFKRQARESLRGFREAAPAVRAALDDHELELWRAGYPDAAVRTATDATGAFRAVLPAGTWLLVVERSVYVQVHASRPGPAPTAQALDPLARYASGAYQHFLPTARLSGFDAVSLWLRELTLEAGQALVLDLHDRGIWLSAVAEETQTPRRLRFSPGGRKR